MDSVRKVDRSNPTLVSLIRGLRRRVLHACLLSSKLLIGRRPGAAKFPS